MKDMLIHFERNLMFLRRYGTEFSDRYPRVGGALGIAGKDPQGERVLQGTALLAARIDKRLEDGYTQFTEGLLEALYPHSLRPFPSCTIAAFDVNADSTARVVPRGTELKAKQLVAGVQCRFRTAADLSLAPLAIKAASFDPLIRAPAGTRLAPDATASLSMTITSISGQIPLRELPLEKFSVFLDGDPSLCAALRDTLFVHASGAFVEAADGRWLPLASVPITPAGFSEAEALIPFGKRSHPAWRVLTEYFCFPDKFRFVDVDLAALRSLLPVDARSVTLHLALSRLRPDGAAARILRTLLPSNFRLGCVPVVNLFAHHARPITVTGTKADYPLVPDATRPEGYEIYTVDRVCKQAKGGEDIVEFTRMHARRKGAAVKGRHWVMRHDDILAEISPGYEKRLSLIDADVESEERYSVSVDLTCTNRDLPLQLGYGVSGAGLSVSDTSDGGQAGFVTAPSPAYRFPTGEAQLDLIGCLSLNHHALIPDGLKAFTELLQLHNLPRSVVAERLIDGVVGLDHRTTMAWMPHAYGSSLVNGLEVQITVDEEAFTGSSIHLFAQVMDQFLALYVQVNSYVELVLLSQRDKREILRCKRRSGYASLA